MENQTILRKKKSNNFTTITNTLLQDSTLSFEARGVAVSLLSRPEDWDISVAALCLEGNIGREKVNRIINELIQAGYMYRSQLRTSGKFGKNVLFISDEKDYLFSEVIEKEQLLPQSEKPLTVKPQSVNPLQQNKDYNKIQNKQNTTTTRNSQIKNIQEISEEQNKEKSSSRSPEEIKIDIAFLKTFTGLANSTRTNILNLSPDMTRKDFSQAFEAVKKEFVAGNIKSFDAVLVKYIKGEWNLTVPGANQEKKKAPAAKAKTIAYDCLDYYKYFHWSYEDLLEKLNSDCGQDLELKTLAREIIDDYMKKKENYA